MADVWVSRKRWTCQYCNVTINDDVPSRRHHETGFRHKNNVAKALQDLYRKGEQERKEAENAKREMDRIERLATASYAKDQAAEAAAAAAAGSKTTEEPTASSSHRASGATSTAPEWKPKDKLAAYGSVQPSLAQQEDARETREQQAEEERLKTGQAGDWEEVVPSQAYHSSHPDHAAPQTTSDRQGARSFRIREKVARFGDDAEEQTDGLGEIRVKKRIRTSQNDEKEDSTSNSPLRAPPDAEKGMSKQEVIKAESGTPLHEDAGATTVKDPSEPTPEGPYVKEEHDKNATGSDGDALLRAAETKTDGDSHHVGGSGGGGGGLFKKRKPGSGAGAKKVRALV